MAFVDQLFPNPRLIHDLEVVVASPTLIVQNGNKEYRIRKQANYRYGWRWPERAMMSTDAQEIARFITEIANFSENSFRFKDPYYNYWSNVQLAYTGSGTRYYLTTRGVLDTHPVFHIGNDVIVTVDGSPVAFTKQIVDGQPVIQVPTNGTVRITGTFFYAARINQADFTRTMSALTGTNGPLVDTIGDIDLIEVFEY